MFSWLRPSQRKKSLSDFLAELENKLSTDLYSESIAEAASNMEVVQKRLEALERLHDYRVKRQRDTKDQRSLFASPGFASIVTGLFTLVASQMPAIFQAYTSTRLAELQAQRQGIQSIIDTVSKDQSIDLDTKLFFISEIASERVASDRFERARPLSEVLADIQHKHENEKEKKAKSTP
jgi:hypothetical protein